MKCSFYVKTANMGTVRNVEVTPTSGNQ